MTFELRQLFCVLIGLFLSSNEARGEDPQGLHNQIEFNDQRTWPIFTISEGILTSQNSPTQESHQRFRHFLHDPEFGNQPAVYDQNFNERFEPYLFQDLEFVPVQNNPQKIKLGPDYLQELPRKRTKDGSFEASNLPISNKQTSNENVIFVGTRPYFDHKFASERSQSAEPNIFETQKEPQEKEPASTDLNGGQLSKTSRDVISKLPQPVLGKGNLLKRIPLELLSRRAPHYSHSFVGKRSSYPDDNSLRNSMDVKTESSYTFPRRFLEKKSVASYQHLFQELNSREAFPGHDMPISKLQFLGSPNLSHKPAEKISSNVMKRGAITENLNRKSDYSNVDNYYDKLKEYLNKGTLDDLDDNTGDVNDELTNSEWNNLDDGYERTEEEGNYNSNYSNLLRKRPNFGHSFVGKRPDFGHSFVGKRPDFGHSFVGKRPDFGHSFVGKRPDFGHSFVGKRPDFGHSFVGKRPDFGHSFVGKRPDFGHNFVGKRPDFGHSFVGKRPDFGHSFIGKRPDFGHSFVGKRPDFGHSFVGKRPDFGHSFVGKRPDFGHSFVGKRPDFGHSFVGKRPDFGHSFVGKRPDFGHSFVGKRPYFGHTFPDKRAEPNIFETQKEPQENDLNGGQFSKKASNFLS